MMHGSTDQAECKHALQRGQHPFFKPQPHLISTTKAQSALRSPGFNLVCIDSGQLAGWLSPCCKGRSRWWRRGGGTCWGQGHQPTEQ